jgi:hypothetical protein
MRWQYLLVLAAAFAAGLLAPAPGWAVVGAVNVTVKDESTGVPVVGASVIIEGETKTTGLDGTAHFKEVEGGVRSVNIKIDGYRSTSRTINVLGGVTNEMPVQLRPLFPWMGQNPGGLGIGVSGGGGIGPRQRFTLTGLTDTVFVPGSPNPSVFVQSNAFNAAASSGNAFALDMSGGGGTVNLGLPSIPLGPAGRLFPVAIGGIGAASVNMHMGNNPLPFVGGSPFQISGTVTIVTAGGALLWQPPPIFNVEPFAEAKGGYSFALGTDLDRDPSNPAFTDHFNWSQWYVGGRIGVNLFDRRVAPYAGILYNQWSPNVLTTFVIPGTSTRVQRAFEFGGNETAGVFGVDVRPIPNLPLFFTAEGRVSPQAISGFFSMGMSFDLDFGY